ncbi:MAG: hypothetical protein ABSC34_12190, partial [Acidimicrobiales bacterium]
MKNMLRITVLGSILAPSFIGVLSSGAATPKGEAILVHALADARNFQSYELRGSFTVSGKHASLVAFQTATAEESISSIQGLGTVYLVQPTAFAEVYVRTNTVSGLINFLGIKATKTSELNVWYYLTPSDSRYDEQANTGPTTVATQFTVGSKAFGRAGTYVNVVTLRGTRVIKLAVTSSMFSPNNNLVPMTLYVTDS